MLSAPEQQAEIIGVWETFRDDPEAWVAIITGEGERAFCAGADLKTYTPALAERDIYDLRQDADRPGFGGITRGLNIWKPIIAAVNGYALAGGLELALACDIRVASENAVFGCSEVQRGFHHCDGGTVRLPLIVGLGNALRMQLTGEHIGAEEALRMGLVSEVVPQQQLMPAAERYADLICANGPLGVRSAKESMIRSLGRGPGGRPAVREYSVLDADPHRGFRRGAAGLCRQAPAGVEGQMTAGGSSTPSP